MLSVRVFAQLVSRVFGPFSIMPVIGLYLVVFQTGIEPSIQMTLLSVLLVSHVIFPILFFLYLKMRGRISDFDITDRRERNQWMNWVMVGQWLGLLICFQYDPISLFKILSVFSTSVLTLSAFVTNFWKISLHLVTATIIFVAVIVIYGTDWWWLIFLLPLVGWSRWYLKKHTVAQLLVGSFVPIAVFLTAMLFLLK